MFYSIASSNFCAKVREVCNLVSERFTTFSPLRLINHPCVFHEIIILVSNNTGT